jgi:hypothetical protein
VRKEKSKRRSAFLWLGLVGFLLMVPPFLPMALLSEKPILYSSIALAYALIFGSIIWMISNAMESKRKRND